MHETEATMITSSRTKQPRRGGVPEPIDLVVDRGVLLDVGVGLGDVGLGLVVVVVGDEVLHPVLGEELAELVGELRRQRLVRGEHQRGALHLLDGPGDGGRLSRSGYPEQRLEAVASVDSLGQLVDRLGLITGWGEVGHDLELGHVLEGNGRMGQVLSPIHPSSR